MLVTVYPGVSPGSVYLTVYATDGLGLDLRPSLNLQQVVFGSGT